MPRQLSSLQPTRRSAVATLLAAAASLAADPALAARRGDWPSEVKLGPARPFSFDGLRAMVRALARKGYKPPLAPPPALTHAVDYDAFGHAVYRPDATLWGQRPGDEAVRFFPMGFAAPIPVAVSVVSGSQARPVTFADDLFDMPADSPLRRLGPNAGFGGFRVMNADRRTDWIAYLGASYFRSADPFNQYGLSARGIALDTAASRPEEFPAFTAFWLQPDPAGLIVYALLDGPSVAGAYRIAHQRSPAGLVQEIQAELGFRAPVERLVRPDRSPADRRLAPPGARFRRPLDLDRRGRAHLAPACQPAPRRGQRLP
jgi:glucans biosynthesis protein